MRFQDYQKIHDCKPLFQTQQSWAFLVDNKPIVCKRYPRKLDRCREEMAYYYIRDRELLRIPELYSVGEDFMEIQFIEKDRETDVHGTIEDIAKMYLATMSDSDPRGYFPKLDLSKDKLRKRIQRIPTELERRGISEGELIGKCERFVESDYQPSSNQCLIHGDLKSPHIIESKNGRYFIDLALLSVASPWYDLAVLFMEHRDRIHFLSNLSQMAYEIFGRTLGLSLEETRKKLLSGIVYRSVYDIGFAARHRSDKSLARTINDLKVILNMEEGDFR